MSLSRYPEYRDSGVEWLGEIPTHWPVTQLRHLTTCLDGRRVPLNSAERLDRPGSTPYWGANAIMGSVAGALFDEELVLLGEDGAPFFDKCRPVAFHSTGPVWPNNHIHVLRPNAQVQAKFLVAALNAVDYAQFIDGSTRDKLTQGGMNSIPIAAAPIDEQVRISGFICRETSKINALIAEQEKLLALLAEKRQATISHAVTHGLDPNAPMKDSGIPWLGEVPAHWDVVPLMWMTDPSRPIMYGIVLPGPDAGEGVPILKGGNVKPARMNLESMARTTPEIEVPYARARLKPGDLVYAIRGTIGDCEIVPVEMDGANITQDVARVAVADTEHAGWVRWALLSAPVREELAVGSLGAAVRGVNIFDLKRVKVPKPPVAEQSIISRYLHERIGEIDHLSMASTNAIALLKERRSALVSAAVTGKIDVRGLVVASV